MAFKKPSINKITTDIKNLMIYIRTLKKFGKSTLFRDIILEKYGDPERGLLIGLGAEAGYTLLDNLNATQIETWQELIELKEWLIEQKGKEHNIEILAFDVIDELLPIVEAEVCRLSVIETKKPAKTINAAFGGYGSGQEMVKQMLKEFFIELKKAGFGIFCIAHTKYKNVKQKGDIDEGYMTLTSTLQTNYESIFGDVFDCVLTGYIDREVEEENITDDKVIRRATDEIRKLYFRGNTFIDAGCRFKEGSVPEYMVFDKPNMAKDFINVLEEGMRLSMTNQVSKEEFKSIQVQDEIETDKKAEEYISTKNSEPQVDDEEVKGKLVKDITGKFKVGNPDQKAKVKEILNGVKLVDANVSTLTKIMNIFA